jgi:hypothetical protein
VTGKSQLAVSCPLCGGRLLLGPLQFAGMPILVDCRCSGCGRAYRLDWPAGHALLHPVLIDVEDGHVYADGLDWYARRLARCLAGRGQPVSAAIEVHVKDRPASRAILVNCVDFLYGHCLLKLLGGLSYARRNPDADVIVAAPAALRWLAPDVSSVIVDLPLEQGDSWINGFHDAVAGALGAYDEIVIAPGVSQPPLTAEDLERLLGPEFAPQDFWASATSSAGEESPLVCLVSREDRPWAGPHRWRAGLAGRLSPELRRRVLVADQNRRFERVVRRVRESCPEARFVLTGIGAGGRLSSDVLDLRCDAAPLTEERERGWLAAYASSRVVAGVHGSNMLLPSALGGAVVDLLPEDRLRNLGQDLIITSERDRDPKLCLFRYRIVPLTTSPEAVADIIVSILEDADRHHLNMRENTAAYTTVGWPRPIRWRRVDARVSGDQLRLVQERSRP